MASYARIGFYSFKPGTLDPLLAKAEQELPSLMQQQPGFMRYAVVRSGADSIVSLSAWETREQSDAAVRQLTGWVRENFGPDMESVDNQIGEVILSAWSADHLPTWGRVHSYTFKRPVSEVMPPVRDNYMPLLKQQPGFNTYTVFQTGDNAAISYATFDSKAQGEAAMATASQWLQEHIAPTVQDVQRLEGDLVWTVRKA